MTIDKEFCTAMKECFLVGKVLDDVFMDLLNQNIDGLLSNNQQCPRYGNCRSGEARYPSTCSLYGCTIEREHSALGRLHTQYELNGDRFERFAFNHQFDERLRRRNFILMEVKKIVPEYFWDEIHIEGMPWDSDVIYVGPGNTVLRKHRFIERYNKSKTNRKEAIIGSI